MFAISKIMEEPGRLINALAIRGYFNWMSDERYIRLAYMWRMGKKLNLENPISFTEKLQWLKLHDRNSVYPELVDKYGVRCIIADRLGEEYLIPLIAQYDRIEDIEWEKLPDQFVLKCTHGSSTNIICTDKSAFDKKKAQQKLKVWMNRDWYWFGREWPYKNMKRRIIVEQYMVDESGNELKDYKINCFNGEPKFIQVMSGRNAGAYYLNQFDTEWHPTPTGRKHHVPSKTPIAKPSNLLQLLEIARILSNGMPYVRIDLYIIDHKIYFGEITFFPASGYIDYADEKIDIALGKLIDLEGIH